MFKPCPDCSEILSQASYKRHHCRFYSKHLNYGSITLLWVANNHFHCTLCKKHMTDYTVMSDHLCYSHQEELKELNQGPAQQCLGSSSCPIPNLAHNMWPPGHCWFLPQYVHSTFDYHAVAKCHTLWNHLPLYCKTSPSCQASCTWSSKCTKHSALLWNCYPTVIFNLGCKLQGGNDSISGRVGLALTTHLPQEVQSFLDYTILNSPWIKQMAILSIQWHTH